MAQTVVGIFNSAEEAQNAVNYLLSNGFTQDDIDVSGGSGSNYDERYSGDKNESGIGRFFRNLFGDDDNERARYTKAAERGTLVTVYTDNSDEARRASLLLDQYGAIDIDDSSTGTAAGKNYYGENEGQTVPVIEENLQVGKREVETGGVRLKSRIIEKPVEESLRLREEHVRVERTAVDRPATEADFNNFKEGSVELTEHAEIPVVSKEARVVEEVSLGKEVEHHEETVHETVRKTEVDIEEIEGDKKSRKGK